jgi:tungstate transport system ATP-binding protein
MPEQNIYELRNLTHSYGKHQSLDISHLDIPEGKVVGLTGPNGSGKSTLLKVLAFLTARPGGLLLFEGQVPYGREREMRQKVSLLLQTPYLLRRTVYENVAYGLKLRGLPKGRTDDIVAGALALVGMDYAEFAHRPWFRLSGGEAQRVSLASRLAIRPKVLLLDEPTANVDEASAVLIKEAIVRAKTDHGATIAIATHDAAWLNDVAAFTVGLYSGRVVPGAANLLIGDWTTCEDDGDFVSSRIRGHKILASSQGVSARTKCAALDPSDIGITTGEDALIFENRANTLRGVIVQMSLERSSGDIICVAGCGELSLRVRLKPEKTAELKLYPGLTVALTFQAGALKFI